MKRLVNLYYKINFLKNSNLRHGKIINLKSSDFKSYFSTEKKIHKNNSLCGFLYFRKIILRLTSL